MMAPIRRRGILLLSLLLFLAPLPPLGANPITNPQKNQEIQDDIDGFGEELLLEEDFSGEDPFADADAAIQEAEVSPLPSPRSLRPGGFLELTGEMAYNKDEDRLSSLRPLGEISLEWRPSPQWQFKVSGRGAHEAAYEITDRENPEDLGQGHENQDDEEWEALLWEAHGDVGLAPGIRFKAGRQIISWGESNYARILDILNPRDMTRPGLMELEDARIPVAAMRLSAQGKKFSLEAVSIHQNPGDKISGLGGDFDAFAPFRSPGLPVKIKEKDRESARLDPETYAIKLKHAHSGGDINLVAARSLDTAPVLTYAGKDHLGYAVLEPVFEPMTLLGLSATQALGSTLFKWEGVFRWDRAVQRKDIIQQSLFPGATPATVKGFEKRDQMETLVGLEYTGMENLVLVLEGKCLYTLDHTENLAIEETLFQTYAQANYKMWNDTLEWEVFWVWMDPGKGHILRLSGEYAFTDHLFLKVGVAFYDAATDQAMVHPYRDMDRLFSRLTICF